MEKIGIKELRNLYEKIFEKNYRFLSKKIKSFNYLNLSILYSRDDREFDINNFQLLKKLLKNKNLKKENQIFQNKKISGYHKYLFSLKESNYLPSKKLPIILFLDLLKYIKQIFDIFGIFLIIFCSILINNLKAKNKITKRSIVFIIGLTKNLNRLLIIIQGLMERRQIRFLFHHLQMSNFIQKVY